MMLFVMWSGRGSGAGFVIYSTKQECDKCIEELNNCTPQGFTTPLTVKYANAPAQAAHPKNNHPSAAAAAARQQVSNDD